MFLVKRASKQILGVDIDGVLNNLNSSLSKLLIKEYNAKIDITNYDLFKQCGLSTSEKNAFLEKVNSKLMKIKPEWRCQEYLNEIQKQYKIFILTARPEKIEKDTLTWLYMNNIPYNKIYFNAGLKYKLCKKLKVKYMIDDSPWNIRYLNIHKVHSLIFDRPYNTRVKETAFIKRVYSWQDIYEYLF